MGHPSWKETVSPGNQDGSDTSKPSSQSPWINLSGGMKLQRIPELRAFYGDEVMFLVGGDLVKNGPDIEKNCAMFREAARK
jgi:ribulose-bisphosphate carboxylase large chain